MAKKRGRSRSGHDAQLLYRVYFKATPALRTFRRVLGKANYDLNTARAGLIELAKLKNAPEMSFPVDWSPANLRAAAEDAEAFAVKALLVYAVDALDRYMRKVESPPPSVVRDPNVASLLRAEFQTSPSTAPPTPAEVVALSKALVADPSAVSDLIKSFRAKHLSKTYRPGMRARFDALMSLCPSVPAHHRAVAHILVAWRNRHVHGDTNEGVAPSVETDWRNGLTELRRSNPRADGLGLLDRFCNEMKPTADDVTTLIALLHRTISTADKDLIAAVDLEFYARQVVVRHFHSLDDPLQFAKDIWGRTELLRATKLLNLTVKAGFHRVSRTKLPNGVNAVPDEIWLNLAQMNRSEFLAEMESKREADNSVAVSLD
jgi:hypothetical protein